MTRIIIILIIKEDYASLQSNEEFNTIISETKKDETKFKGEKDQEDFQFMLGTPNW